MATVMQCNLSSLAAILEKIFDDLEAEFGKFFSKTASYISASKHGLTEMEILDLLSCNSQVSYYLNNEYHTETKRGH